MPDLSLDEHIRYLEYVEFPYVVLLDGKIENRDSHWLLLGLEIVAYFKAKWIAFKKRPLLIILTAVTVSALPVP